MISIFCLPSITPTFVALRIDSAAQQLSYSELGSSISSKNFGA